MQENEVKSGIVEAVERAGSQEKLALALGTSQQNVSKWVRRGYVPSSRVVEIETQFGVPRQRLIDPRLVDLVEPVGGDL